MSLATGYTDLLAGSNMPASENPQYLQLSFNKAIRKIERVKKKVKKLKQFITSQRIAEEARIAEELRKEEDAKKIEKSFWSKAKDAVIKTIPAVIVAVGSLLVKSFLSRFIGSVKHSR